MKYIYHDFKQYLADCKRQDFAFFAVFAYLVFSYLRPQVIYPWLDIIPWTQIAILTGLFYSVVKGYFKFQFVHFILLLFALVITASAFNSQYPEISLDKLHIIYIWVLEVIFFTVCIRNIKQYYLIAITFLLILFKMSFFGAKTWASRGFGFRDWGIAGPDGFFSNSGEFSLLMAMLAVLSFSFLYATKTTRKIYYILPVTAIMTVIGASSRGGQLALAVGLLILAVFVVKFRIKNVLAFVLVLLLAFTFFPEEQKQRFLAAGEDNTSISRLLYWEKGLDMMERHSLLGVGFYAFPHYFHDYYSDAIDPDLAVFQRAEVAHNSFIEVGADVGYLGLFIYLWLILYCYHLNRKTKKIIKESVESKEVSWATLYATGINITLLVYMIGSFFMSVAFYPYIYLLLMFSQSLLNSVEESVQLKSK